MGSREEKWLLRHKELCDYIELHNKSPSQNTNIGMWVSNTRMKYVKHLYIMSETHIRTIWEDTIQKYPCLCDLETKWKTKYTELCTFMDTFQRLPSIEENKQLHIWSRTQQESWKKRDSIMKNADIWLLWKTTMERYPWLTTFNDRWRLKHQELCDYMDTHSNAPKKGDKLYDWVINQRLTYKQNKRIMSVPEFRKIWEDTVQKYSCLGSIDPNERWIQSHTELCKFIDDNGDRPTKKTRLGQWLGTQKETYKKQENIMADPEIRKIWEDTLQKYPCLTVDNVIEWKHKLTELCTFIDTNGFPPYKHSKNIVVQTIGRWVGMQKQTYKKQKYIMVDPDIRKIWEDTVQKYPCLSDKPIKSMKLATHTTPTESSEQKRQRVHSELSQLHQKYKTLTSDHLREAFTEDPSLWHKYHDISEENETSFPEQEIPRNRIIQELAKIKTKRTKLVVDMGCGKAHIARHFQGTRFKFINLDHVACDETVTACDISNTTLEEDSVEVCILSLAMWGSNCKDYLREAHRILESNGILYLIEPTKRWTETEPADKLSALLEESGFRIVEKTIVKFALFICSK